MSAVQDFNINRGHYSRSLTKLKPETSSLPSKSELVLDYFVKKSYK